MKVRVGMIKFEQLKPGCPFLYGLDGELFMLDNSGCVVELTGKCQGGVEDRPEDDCDVYPVKVTMTYKI